MTQDNRHYMVRSTAGLIPGLILAGLGMALLLSNLGIVPFYNFWLFWPVILIAIGAVKLVDSLAANQRISGGIMVVVGMLFLALNLGWLSWRIWEFWPVALIALGAVMLLQRLGPEETPRRTCAAREGGTTGFALFSGFNHRITTDDYRGGDYTAIFGGGDVNLRRAGMEGDTAVINVTAIFGGINMKVPEHWLVINRVVGIFGGSEDKTVQPAPNAPGVKRLVIQGAAIFGGLSIKN
jgi:hypothetical protein